MTSLETGSLFEIEGFRLEGLSLSGIRTAIAIHELGICFDVAQGFPFTLRPKKFFISHGHLDHAAGIPYIISQKAMRNEAHPIFYIPPSLIEPMTEIMKMWEKIEKHEYRYEFRPVSESQRIDLNPRYFIQPFATVHRIESFGYTLFSHLKKLKAEFSGLEGREIAELKKQGTAVEEWVETPLVSFTGDTQIEFLDRAPFIRKSKVLIMESTYLDDRKTVEKARQWGHTHLDEILPRLQDIESEKILLIHASSRYSDAEAQKILDQRIPPEHRARVVLFPGR